MDIQAFSITPLGPANVNMPRATIAGRIEEPSGTVVADFTGANALTWPGVVNQLTAEQRSALIDLIAQTLLLMRAGLL